MKLKTITAASLVALTTLGTQAADLGWGEHQLLETAFGSTEGGVIFDTYSFSLGAQSEVASSVSALGLINSGTYSLFGVGLDGQVGTTDDVGLGAWTFGSEATVNSVSLAAGDYYYSVFGFAAGPAAYAVSSAATVTPVPEPGSYALLAAGLGVIGVVVSRRRQA